VLVIGDKASGSTDEGGSERTAEAEKLGGAEEAKGDEERAEVISKSLIVDSPEARAPELAAGESETDSEKEAFTWMVPSSNEESAILEKDGVNTTHNVPSLLTYDRRRKGRWAACLRVFPASRNTTRLYHNGWWSGSKSSLKM
jgi:hypothetical protein